jgi:hypothetical protein
VTRRPGFALVVSLLLVVVLAALGAAMLAVGAREAEIATALARRSVTRVGAESAARWVAATWSTREYSDLPVGDSAVLTPLPDLVGSPLDSPGGQLSGRVLRLAPGLFLVEGAAATTDGLRAADAKAAMLIRTMDVDALAASFPAAVSARDSIIVRDGTISGVGGCGGHDVAAVLAPRSVIAADASVEGAPDVVVADPPDFPSPDPFADSLASVLATVTLGGGTASPRPWLGPDACQEHPLNWGAISPASPCYHRLPLVRVTADLHVAGGEAHGLLLVHGDVHIQGLELHGLLIADGHLTIGSGTSIHGAVHARSVEVAGGALTYDGCAMRRALSAGGLDRPFRPAHRQWIPTF